MGCGSSQKQQQDYGILSKPHIFFLLGGPGSGKGTQAENLIRDYRFLHLSTGDLLREERQKGGQDAEMIQNFIKNGKLLPSSLVVKLLKKCISVYGNRRYLFDGFPRNFENWEEFQKQLSDHCVVRNLIYFDCPTQVLVDRIMERAKQSGRSDDNPETIKKRLETFENETIPIVKDFEGRGNCIKVDATKSREEVYKELREKLSSYNVEPPAPAQLIFVLGGPGSGKGTQCAVLVKKYGFIHLSTGDLLRDQVKSGSPLGKQIQAKISKGQLVSSELMVKLIQQKIERNNYGGRYLLDGFPRGQENMDVWEKIMARWVDLKTILYFDCAEDELVKRLLNRGLSSGRSDDNEETIKKRLKVFNDHSKPVIDHYSKLGKVCRIDANRPVQKITEAVESHLSDVGIYPKVVNKAKPKAFLVLGNSGSGKGTQSKKIAEKFGFHNIATGDLLRAEMKQNGRHKEIIEESMRLGKLVPTEIVVKLMKQEIEKKNWEGVFLIDGFPRNKDNLIKWNEQIGVEVELVNMFLLNCSQETTLKRLTKRGQTSGRNDDNPESIKKKRQTYDKETVPVIQKFKRDAGFVIQINADREADQVYKDIKAQLNKLDYKEK